MIASGLRRLSLPSDLEQTFERETRADRIWLIRTSASTDPLTGLWDRRYLGELMEAVGRDAAATIMSAILVDIDPSKPSTTSAVIFMATCACVRSATP